MVDRKRGDRSLEMLNEEISEFNEFERFRLKIKPGITGAWQVSPTRNSPIHHNVDYDIYQIINNSLRYNIKQILKTIQKLILLPRSQLNYS